MCDLALYAYDWLTCTDPAIELIVTDIDDMLKLTVIFKPPESAKRENKENSDMDSAVIEFCMNNRCSSAGYTDQASLLENTWLASRSAGIC